MADRFSHRVLPTDYRAVSGKGLPGDGQAPAARMASQRTSKQRAAPAMAAGARGGAPSGNHRIRAGHGSASTAGKNRAQPAGVGRAIANDGHVSPSSRSMHAGGTASRGNLLYVSADLKGFIEAGDAADPILRLKARRCGFGLVGALQIGRAVSRGRLALRGRLCPKVGFDSAVRQGCQRDSDDCPDQQRCCRGKIHVA